MLPNKEHIPQKVTLLQQEEQTTSFENKSQRRPQAAPPPRWNTGHMHRGSWFSQNVRTSYQQGVFLRSKLTHSSLHTFLSHTTTCICVSDTYYRPHVRPFQAPGGDSPSCLLPDPNAVVSTPHLCTPMVCAPPTACDHMTAAEKQLGKHSCDLGPCPLTLDSLPKA